MTSSAHKVMKSIASRSTIKIDEKYVEKTYNLLDDATIDSDYEYLVNELFFANLLENVEGYSQISDFIIKSPQYTIKMTNLGKPINQCKIENKLKVFIQILKLIYDLHKNKIIHGDLNPNHILMDDKGKISIIDFSNSILALPYDANNKQLPENDRRNEKMCDGTIIETTSGYRSPECFDKSYEKSYNHDIWSLGCVFYELVTGNKLFENDDQIMNVLYIENKMKLLNDEKCKYVINQCLQIDPTSRNTTRNLIGCLESYLNVNNKIYVPEPRIFYKFSYPQYHHLYETMLRACNLPDILNNYANKLIYHVTPKLSSNQKVIRYHEINSTYKDEFDKHTPDNRYEQYDITTLIYMLMSIVFCGSREVNGNDLFLIGNEFFTMYWDLLKSYKMSLIFA